MQKHVAFVGGIFAFFAGIAMSAAGQMPLAAMLLFIAVGLLWLDRDDQWPQHRVASGRLF